MRISDWSSDVRSSDLRSRRRFMDDILRFRDDQPAEEPAVTLAAFLDQDGAVSVRIEAGDAVRLLLPVLDRVRLVEVDFQRFLEGRGSSSRRVLSESGYTWRTQATGDRMDDEMLRVGG